VGAGRQFPVLDKQSSTNTDSHSELKSTSYISFSIHQSKNICHYELGLGNIIKQILF
jgi:hypothetical protein